MKSKTMHLLLALLIAKADASSCEHVDVRPHLERLGFDPIRNRGGRETSTAFAATELLSLEVEQPISARWFEHFASESHLDTKKALRAALTGQAKPCLESDVPSEDIESTRLARLKLLGELAANFPEGRELFDLFSSREFNQISMSPHDCKTHAEIKSKSHLSDATESEIPSMEDDVLLVARRMNPNTDQCEVLVRRYTGPSIREEWRTLDPNAKTWVFTE